MRGYTLALCAIAGCGQSDQTAPPTTTATVRPRPVVPSASSPAVPSASTSVPPPPPQAVACKGHDAKAPVSLFQRTGAHTGTVLQRAHLIVTTWDGDAAKGEILRVSKVDGTLTVLAVIEGIEGKIRGLAADAEHVYFTRAEKLYRVAVTGGAPELLVESFAHRIEVADGKVYGLDFDSKSSRDAVWEVDREGGTPREVWGRLRVNTRQSHILRSLVVHEGTAYVADSGRARIVAVPLEGGEEKVLARDENLPGDMVRYGDDLIFVADEGMRRLALRGGQVRDANPHGRISIMGWRWAIGGDALFAADTWNDPHRRVFRVPLTGEAREQEVLRMKHRLVDIAADAECIYLVSDAGLIDRTWVYAVGISAALSPAKP